MHIGKHNRLLVVCSALLLVCAALCGVGGFLLVRGQPVSNSTARPEKQRTKPEKSEEMVVDLRDLPPEFQTYVEEILSHDIGQAINDAFWQELGIIDKIELAFFANVDKLISMRNADTQLTVCLIKPGNDVTIVRDIVFGDGQGGDHAAMKYTCITAPLPDAFAIVHATTEIDEGELAGETALLLYGDGVWKRALVGDSQNVLQLLGR